ncbi:flagellar hook-associated protein FlgK [Megalodesulfovibrio paquesii]
MINALLYTGTKAMMNALVGISVTGENIANVDTEGYSRRSVSYVTSKSITMSGGLTLGTGAEVDEIRRNYDSLLESSYIRANSSAAYYEAQASTLYNVETYFGETDDYGVSTALDTFWDSLTALQEDANNAAVREELVNYSETLIDSMVTLDNALQDTVDTLESEVEQSVDEANQLMEQIAALNAGIVANPNDLDLQDQRDVAVRELSSLMDVKVIEDGNQYTVLTTSGQTLVQDDHAYKIAWEGPQVTTDLSTGSTFDGKLYYTGDSAEELLVEFTSSGPADGSATAATFRVSLDGGATWVTDEDGNVMEFTAGGYDDRVEVAGLEIYFGQADNPYAAATTDLAEGDSFDVMPKSGLYWYSTTGGKVNITPLESSASNNRLSGGSMAGLITTRDQNLLAYQEELDAIAHELIWEVNYQHSQGAGLEHYSATTGSYAVENTTEPLGESSLPYADHMQAGSLAFAFYDEDTGEALGVQSLDFSSIVPPGTANFDPSVHSLEDVATAINTSYAGQMTATIQDGQLKLTAEDGVEFEFAGDSSGLCAALGLNTYYAGQDVESMAVDARILADSDHINAAMVDASGEVSSGDNSNALALAALAEKDVSLDSLYNNTSQTLSEHLHGLAGKAGADTDVAARNYTQAYTLAADLDERQQEVAGVSMDEELANLTRYQQAYEAASQLITTANELFDVVMSLKS